MSYFTHSPEFFELNDGVRADLGSILATLTTQRSSSTVLSSSARTISLGAPLGPLLGLSDRHLARGGIISWTDPTGPSEKRFLIDANIFNGNSGGPVFRVRNGLDRAGELVLSGGMTLIGIVVEDAYERSPVLVGSQPVEGIDPATGKTMRAEAKVLNIGGIGIVEPISKARELVEANCSR